MSDNQWWHDLRNARTRINRRYKAGEEPIQGTSKGEIQVDLEDYLDSLEEHYQDKWKQYLPADLPDTIIPWYEKIKAHRMAGGYWPFYRGMLPRLVELDNLNAIKVYLVYRNRANNGNTVNKNGLAPGETMVGNRTLAKEARVNVSYVHRANKILADAALVAFVRRKWIGGPWVKRVAMMPDERVVGLPMNREGSPSLKGRALGAPSGPKKAGWEVRAQFESPEAVEEIKELTRELHREMLGSQPGIRLYNDGRYVSFLPRRPGIVEDLSDEELTYHTP